MKILNKLKSVFASTPRKKNIKLVRNFGWKFYNRDLATNETIFSAVMIKANAIVSAPVQIQQNYQKLTPYEHNLAYLFKFGPNPRQTMFNFIQFMEASRNTNSGAYAIIEYDRLGDVKFIWPLKSDYVTPLLNEDDNELYYRIRDIESNDIAYIHNSHIIALEYLDNNGYKGINPLDVLTNTIDYDTEVKEFSLNQMKESLKANAVVTIQSELSPELIDEYDEMMEGMQEAGIIYLDSTMDFKELSGKTAVDANIGTVDQITVERVERVFNIVGKLTKGSSSNNNGSNSDTEDLLFLKDSLLPIVRQYEQEFSKKLLNEHEKMNGYEIKIQMNGYARATMEKRGNFYQIMLRNGVMSVNEVRALEDLRPVKDGDKRYMSRDLWDAERYDEFMSSNSGNNLNKNNNEEA